MKYINEELAQFYAIHYENMDNALVEDGFLFDRDALFISGTCNRGMYWKSLLLTDFEIARTAGLIGSNIYLDTYRYIKFMTEQYGENYINEYLKFIDNIHNKKLAKLENNNKLIKKENTEYKSLLSLVDEIKRSVLKFSI